MWTVVTNAAPWQQQAGWSSNVVSALSILNVAPNAKGKKKKKKSIEEHVGRGDIWADLGGAPTRFLYVELANFQKKKTKKKNPIFWQMIASFENISSSRVSTMHMLREKSKLISHLRGVLKLCKRKRVKIGHSWTSRRCCTAPPFLKLR